jgi:hypothetical protein
MAPRAGPPQALSCTKREARCVSGLDYRMFFTGKQTHEMPLVLHLGSLAYGFSIFCLDGLAIRLCNRVTPPRAEHYADVELKIVSDRVRTGCWRDSLRRTHTVLEGGSMPVSLHFCSASEHNGSNDARWQANEGGAAAYATSSVLVICGTKDVVKSQLSNGDLLNKFQVHKTYVSAHVALAFRLKSD